MPRVRDLYADCRVWWSDEEGTQRTIELPDGQRLLFSRELLAGMLVDVLAEIESGVHTRELEKRAGLLFRLCTKDEIAQAQEVIAWAEEQAAS
jgi:hypothetical protein